MMTIEEAQANVGELVRVHSRSAGRPHMGKLLEVIGRDIGKVQPGGHKKVEFVNLAKLSVWKKGQHEGARHRGEDVESAQPAPQANLVNTPGLLELARPGEGMATVNVSKWIKQGLIPQDCFQRRAPSYGGNLYDVDKLRATGFFDKVKPRRSWMPARVEPPAPAPEPTPAPVAQPEPLPMPAPKPDALDTLAALEAALRAELDAELRLLEARTASAKARFANELAKLRGVA